MTKTEIKQEAQDRLMNAVQIAFYKIAEDGEHDENEAKTIADEMSKQMERIEKMFGYEPKSWNRG